MRALLRSRALRFEGGEGGEEEGEEGDDERKYGQQ